ncbi:MAG: hypothetical protein JRD89_00925 [Deltaproteobacteria bacterium]|nr:hypothetical protein [Deltaproteobacteria bacterium]
MPIDSFGDLATYILILFALGLVIIAYFFWMWESAVEAKIDKLERQLRWLVEKRE